AVGCYLYNRIQARGIAGISDDANFAPHAAIRPPLDAVISTGACLRAARHRESLQLCQQLNLLLCHHFTLQSCKSGSFCPFLLATYSASRRAFLASCTLIALVRRRHRRRWPRPTMWATGVLSSQRRTMLPWCTGIMILSPSCPLPSLPQLQPGRIRRP